MAHPSETLDQHFETTRPTPPHEIMRARALEQAAKFGIPYEIAVKAIDQKLQMVASLYEEMIVARVDAEGEIGKIRAEVDAHVMASRVLETHNNIENRLAELGAIATKDVRDMVAGGGENLTFAPAEEVVTA